jgi:hypothetical protein
MGTIDPAVAGPLALEAMTKDEEFEQLKKDGNAPAILQVWSTAPLRGCVRPQPIPAGT